MFHRFRNFLKNSSGNIALTGTLLMLPLMASVGIAVDYSNFANQQNSVQQALDAAGLATGRFMNTGADVVEIEAYAENFFKANLTPDINYNEAISFSFALTPGDTSIDPPIPTKINLGADLEYDTHFSDFLSLDQITSAVTSVISLGNRTVEVALVMDNSGSMATNNRIGILKTETKKLIDIIFNAAQFTDLPDPVKFSIIPFGASVNIGTNNENKNWMDKKGWSSIHHEHFDWDTYSTGNQTRYKKKNGDKFAFQEKIDGSWQWRTRLTAFDMIGVEWGGCVEMRPWPHNVLDTVAFTNTNYTDLRDSVDADGDGSGDGNDALFVYNFAPDAPDHIYLRNNGYTYNDSRYYYNNYASERVNYNGSPIYADTGINGETNQYGSTRQINRTNWMFKYQSGFNTTALNEWNGPNYSCSTNPIEPLNNDSIFLKSKIDEMQANGSTNLQQGLTWGWRTLSPGEPFTEGRDKNDYQNMKFLIMLSDGNNFYSQDNGSGPNRTTYGAWGFARPDGYLAHPFSKDSIDPNDPKWETHNRWAEGLDYTSLAGTIYQSASFDLTPESYGEFELIMNAHTNQACRNIKNDGISIFTIAFDVANGSSVKNLLDACSGSGLKDGDELLAGGKFYFDVNGEELETAMEDIANQIADMRIAQ